MAKDRSTFAKHQRELEKKRKSEAKRARQQQKKTLPKPPVEPEPTDPAAEESDA
jgi:hypothetical protein